MSTYGTSNVHLLSAEFKMFDILAIKEAQTWKKPD